MIEKNEDNNVNENNLITIRLITDKRKLLEDQSSQVQKEIRTCFSYLVQALHTREKQLLRQAEAIYRQQISLALSNQEFLPPSVVVLDEREILEKQIRQFGRLELSGSNSTAITNLEPYKVVDYQDIDKDNICFDKSIKNEDGNSASGKIKNLNTADLSAISNCVSPNKQHCEIDIDTSIDRNAEPQRNDSNYTNVREDQSFDSPTKSGKSFTENKHNACAHPEQVQQWLEQILLETEIEPTIHEVEKLPEITEAYICTKLQVET